MRVTYCNAHWMLDICGAHRLLVPANMLMRRITRLIINIYNDGVVIAVEDYVCGFKVKIVLYNYVFKLEHFSAPEKEYNVCSYTLYTKCASYKIVIIKYYI